MRKSLLEALPEGFGLLEIPSYEEYGKLKTADFAVLRTLCLDESAIGSAEKLRFVQKWGAGYDMIDVKALSGRNIPLAVCAGINAQSVAEMAILHILALYRNLLLLDKKVRQNLWPKEEYAEKSYLLQGKTVGHLGLGNISKKSPPLPEALAQMCSITTFTAFGRGGRRLCVSTPPWTTCFAPAMLSASTFPLPILRRI
jgi:phosphoglycerate dehydrogenase-like enzyme